MLCTKDTLGRTETEKRGRSKKGPDPPLRGPQSSYPTRSLGVSPQKEGKWSPLTPATDAYNPRAVNRHGTAKVTNIEGFPQGSIPCPAGIKYTKIGITEALFAFPGLIENNLLCYNLWVRINFNCNCLKGWALGPEVRKKCMIKYYDITTSQSENTNQLRELPIPVYWPSLYRSLIYL